MNILREKLHLAELRCGGPGSGIPGPCPGTKKARAEGKADPKSFKAAASAYEPKPEGYWGSKAAGGQSYYRPGANPTVDAVITRDGPSGEKEILLIKRKEGTVEGGKWALPGGFHDSDSAKGEAWKPGRETAREAAVREVAEETGLDVASLTKNLKTVGHYETGPNAPAPRDPRDNAEAWSKSIAFKVHLPADLAAKAVQGLDDAAEAKWVPMSQLQGQQLAFDHSRILADAKVAPKVKAKPEPKKAEPKKAEPKKAEPKKAEPKKAEPKKAEPKKAEPKKAEPKAAPREAKIADQLQAAYADVSQLMQYKAAGQVPIGQLRDSLERALPGIKPDEIHAALLSMQAAGKAELVKGRSGDGAFTNGQDTYVAVKSMDTSAVQKPEAAAPAPKVKLPRAQAIRESVLKEYETLNGLREYQDGPVPLPRLFRQMSAVSGVDKMTVPEFHEQLMQLWKDDKITLNVLNEVRTAEDPEKGVRIDDKLYYFISRTDRQKKAEPKKAEPKTAEPKTAESPGVREAKAVMAKAKEKTDEVLGRVLRLFHHAIDPRTKLEDMEDAIATLKAINPPMSKLDALWKQMGGVVKYKTKAEAIKAIKVRVLGRKGSFDRVEA